MASHHVTAKIACFGEKGSSPPEWATRHASVTFVAVWSPCIRGAVQVPCATTRGTHRTGRSPAANTTTFPARTRPHHKTSSACRQEGIETRPCKRGYVSGRDGTRRPSVKPDDDSKRSTPQRWTPTRRPQHTTTSCGWTRCLAATREEQHGARGMRDIGTLTCPLRPWSGGGTSLT